MRFVVDHDRHDLRIERACLGGGGGAAMAFQCVAVERVAIEAVFAGNRFRAVELAEFGDAEARGDALADRADPDAFLFVKRHVGEHRHAAHAFGAGRDDDILRARHDRLRGELDRLLR